MTICLNPSCLKQNSDKDNFCSFCGNKLLLDNRYRGIKYLGEGAFGRTFLAEDKQRLNSLCVIKQFIPLPQGKAFDLFKQEAQLLMNLGKNPQIPDLLAFFDQEDIFYLIQEYIEGQDLLKLLLQRQYFSETEVTNFLLQLLPVLQYIHKQKVIHRDIKLENIIFKSSQPNTTLEKGTLVLIDFGVSKQLSKTIMTQMGGTTAGTPGYAPPEQMRGLVNATSDLYALGVCAIRMLTGCIPEEKNETIVDEIFDISEFEWVWEDILQQKGINVSNHLKEILNKMLQDKAKNRFQTATEVLQALQNKTTSSQPPIFNPPSPPPQITNTLKGYFVLPEMQQQGMVRRFGRGRIDEVFYVNENQVIVCAGGGAGLFDFNTGEAIWEIDCPANCGELSDDGKLLALGGNDHIYLWDLSCGKYLRKMSCNKVHSVAISNDSRYLVSGSNDKTVRLWDVATGKEIKQFLGHTESVNSVAISKDSRYLVSGSIDKTLRLWELATGKEIKQFLGYTSVVDSVAISKDSRYLVSGSSDSTVKLWEFATGKEIKQFLGHTSVVDKLRRI